MNKQIVLNATEWETSAIKYMKPRLLDKGSKAISIISKQTNRMLHLNTPLMMTWGISDYTDEKGDSDGKFTISLVFPNEEYRTPATDLFLKKIQDFEEQILDDAEKMSEEWWGKKMSREICKFSMYPILKKNKDPSKPPTLRAKVPCYEGKWKVEIFDTKKNLIFPCEDESLTPIDFVPKLSNVACGLQCSGIWIGGKGWGVTWKLFQCVVKPREIVSIKGCCIDLSPEENNLIEQQQVTSEQSSEQPKSENSTFVDDSDDEEEQQPVAPTPVTPASTPVPAPVPVVETTTTTETSTPTPAPSPVEPPVAPPAPPAVVETPVEVVEEKKVMKKKVIKK